MQKKFKILILCASVMGCIAVIMGAFGSHVLSSQLGPKSMHTYETAVDYQFYHTIAIFMTALLYRSYRIRGLFWIGLFFLGGIFLFSGSLYLLSLRDILGIQSTALLGPMTPLGGLALMGSWAAIFFTVIRIKT
ncbi:DUF423 domain-containing protein [Saprospiraceae bacterium]|nr:DUF423 domain-containing protein [Saprospiraceae bacterium]